MDQTHNFFKNLPYAKSTKSTRDIQNKQDSINKQDIIYIISKKDVYIKIYLMQRAQSSPKNLKETKKEE